MAIADRPAAADAAGGADEAGLGRGERAGLGGYHDSLPADAIGLLADAGDVAVIPLDHVPEHAMVVRLPPIVPRIPRFRHRGQALFQNSAVAADRLARIDAVQHIGTPRLGQGADEEDVSHVARRLLPIALGQIGNDGIENWPSYPSRARLPPSARSCGHIGTSLAT